MASFHVYLLQYKRCSALHYHKSRSNGRYKWYCSDVFLLDKYLQKWSALHSGECRTTTIRFVAFLTISIVFYPYNLYGMFCSEKNLTICSFGWELRAWPFLWRTDESRPDEKRKSPTFRVYQRPFYSKYLRRQAIQIMLWASWQIVGKRLWRNIFSCSGAYFWTPYQNSTASQKKSVMNLVVYNSDDKRGS